MHKYSNAVAELLRQQVEDTIRKHWPNSPLKVTLRDDYVKGESKTIFISFALWPKEHWPNGIIHNDPMYTHIYIYGVGTGQLQTNMSMGNTLYGYNGTPLVRRVGWRNAKGDSKKILRALDNFFGNKLKKAINDNVEGLKLKLERHLVRKASVRLAAMYNPNRLVMSPEQKSILRRQKGRRMMEERKKEMSERKKKREEQEKRQKENPIPKIPSSEEWSKMSDKEKKEYQQKVKSWKKKEDEYDKSKGTYKYKPNDLVPNPNPRGRKKKILFKSLSKKQKEEFLNKQRK